MRYECQQLNPSTRANCGSRIEALLHLVRDSALVQPMLAKSDLVGWIYTDDGELVGYGAFKVISPEDSKLGDILYITGAYLKPEYTNHIYFPDLVMHMKAARGTSWRFLAARTDAVRLWSAFSSLCEVVQPSLTADSAAELVGVPQALRNTQFVARPSNRDQVHNNPDRQRRWQQLRRQAGFGNAVLCVGLLVPNDAEGGWMRTG